MISKVRNWSRAAIQRWAPANVKRGLWNAEFAGGHWKSLESTPSDCVYPFVEKYARGGFILDLGCGSGNTGTELSPVTYERYMGVDISDVAVQMGIQRSAQCGRSAKNQYVQSDILNYTPIQSYDVILFRESLFYIPRSKIAGLLRRCTQCLRPKGVVIVRVCNGRKYAPILDVIRDKFQIVEDRCWPSPGTAIIVFSGMGFSGNSSTGVAQT